MVTIIAHTTRSLNTFTHWVHAEDEDEEGEEKYIFSSEYVSRFKVINMEWESYIHTRRNLYTYCKPVF